ncbi:hypothetical protein D9M73_278540 [compost metagenome]
MSMRHINRGILVAHIDNLYPGSTDMVPQRLQIAALQAEYTIDTLCLQKFGDPGSTTINVLIDVLMLIETHDYSPRASMIAVALGKPCS